MKKYYIIINLLILLITFVFIGKNVIPTKVDIEYLQVVEVIGMDSIKDEVNVSVLLKEQQSGETIGTSEPSSKVLTVASTTYSQAMDIIHTITEKYIIINHVKYYVVGEETAKTNLESVVDYLARTDDTNVKAQVLVAENMTAEQFLNQANSSGMDLVKTLQEASLDINAKNFTTSTTIIELVDIFLKDEIVGVIPYVSIFSKDIEQFNVKLTDGEQEEHGENEDKQAKIFGYMTVGIIQDMKVVDKITLKEVEAYNVVLGNVDNIVVLIRPSNKEKVVITCDTEQHEVRYITNNNLIEKLQINLKYECDLDEVTLNRKLFTIERFEEFQIMVEQAIQKEVQDIIYMSLDSNIDFMELGNMFEMQHPYMYLKIKNNFLTELKKANIEINVKCNINNTFDVMETNKYQKGDDM